MLVKIDPRGFKQTTWREYALRFVAGGCITFMTGLIAQRWGADIGGLFLAFPAILPCSVTLIEKHQREKKQRKSLRGEKRGKDVAAVEAVGTALGSLGLIAFAGTCWWGLARYAAPSVLVAGTLIWALVAVAAWFIRERYRLFFLNRAATAIRN